MKYEKGQPLMSWLYAGPFLLDVSDRYMDNYVVPFEPYLDLWEEACRAQEASAGKEGGAEEGARMTLFGKETAWRLAHTHEADRQLTWAQFGVYAALLCTMTSARIAVAEPGEYTFTLRHSGSLRMLVNNREAYARQAVGRVDHTETIRVFLNAGENSVTMMLFNVHLHCLNTFQLMMDAPCEIRLSLFPLDESLRQAVERGFDAFYLSEAMLFEGKTQFMRAESVPEQGVFQYALHTADGDVLAAGSVKGADVSIPLITYEDLPGPGAYTVDLSWENDGVRIQGTSLRFQRADFIADVPQTDYAGRKRFLLETFATGEGVNHPRSAIFSQLAAMSCGRYDLLDEQAILRVLDYINDRYDCSDFAMHGVLRFYLKYGRHPAVSNNLRERMKACILGFKYWVDEPGKSLMYTRSENHEMLFYSAEYVAGSAFPLESFPNSNQNGLFHALKGRINAEHWIREKGCYGFTEWHSNTYYEEDMLALLNIYDFGEENGLLRQLAKQLLDLIVLFIASNSQRGVMATTHGRCYEPALMHPSTESMSRINYLLFGQPTRLTNSISIGAVVLADSEYQPIPLGARMAAKETLETRTRMGLFRKSYQHGVVCSTYRTAHYMVSGLVESKANEHGAQVNAGQALLEDDVPVFVTCFADRSPTTRPSYFGGQYIIPRTIAYRNVLAYMSHIPGELGFTHCYFPLDQMDETCSAANWMFARRGGAYIAVYCTAPYTQVTGGIYNRRELLSMAKDVTWLFELGDVDTWNSFEAFVQGICAASIGLEGDSLVYHSPGAGVLRLSWGGGCTHDGMPFAAGDEPMIDNPMVCSAYGSGKIAFAEGGVMDFFA